MKLAFSSAVEPNPITPASPNMITKNQMRDLRADLTASFAANCLLPYFFLVSALGVLGLGLLAFSEEVLETFEDRGVCSTLLIAPIATVSF